MELIFRVQGAGEIQQCKNGRADAVRYVDRVMTGLSMEMYKPLTTVDPLPMEDRGMLGLKGNALNLLAK